MQADKYVILKTVNTISVCQSTWGILPWLYWICGIFLLSADRNKLKRRENSCSGMFCMLCKAVLAVTYCYLCGFWLVVTRVMVGIFVGNSGSSNFVFVFEQVLSCIYYRLPCLYVCMYVQKHTQKEKLQCLGNTYRRSSSSRNLIQLCVALFLLL